MLFLLAVNVGSTSLKFKLMQFDPADLNRPRAVPLEGRLEGIGQARSRYRIEAAGRVDERETVFADYEAALARLNAALDELGAPELSAVCFKPVHARDVPLAATHMNDDVLSRMEDFAAVAPVHNPPVIAAVRSFRATMPSTPMIGLFEPAFYSTLEPRVYTESVPADWAERFGVRKYGFHGASHSYIAERAPEVFQSPASESRIVSCHLGGSSSLTAIRAGRAVETTMSFSPQSGLVQGTRCGSIDPFIALYMAGQPGYSTERVAEILARESGLLGLSGVSAEFREIEQAAEAGDERARLAIEVYVYQIQCAVAQMTVSLEGVNALVFTGGIGERGARTRAAICGGLAHLGVEIDPERNAQAIGTEARIERAGSRVLIAVIPTDEELIVAREAAKLILAESDSPRMS